MHLRDATVARVNAASTEFTGEAIDWRAPKRQADHIS